MGVKSIKAKYVKGISPAETPLGIFKDAETHDLKVFDEKGNIEAINAISIPGPQGPQGVQGPVGPTGATGASGLNWRGVYNSGTAYSVNDAVYYDGSSWFSPNGTAAGNTPAIPSIHWFPLALEGAQGATGAQGPRGPQGLQGPSGASFVRAGDVTIVIDQDTPTTYTSITNDLTYSGSPTVGLATVVIACSGSKKFGTGKVMYGDLNTGGAGPNSQVFFTLRGDGAALLNVTIRSSSVNTGVVTYEIINNGPDITAGAIRFNWLII